MPLIVQIVGYKNTGKTTWVCRLTERFKKAGYKVGTIKRDAHDFHMDTPGTDTWKHQEAGADMTAITSATRTAIIKQHSESLDQIIAQMPEADIILIEGFKHATYPKIIMLRNQSDLQLLHTLTNPIAAVVWREMHSVSLEYSNLSIFTENQTDELYDQLLALYHNN